MLNPFDEIARDFKPFYEQKIKPKLFELLKTYVQARANAEAELRRRGEPMPPEPPGFRTRLKQLGIDPDTGEMSDEGKTDAASEDA